VVFAPFGFTVALRVALVWPIELAEPVVTMGAAAAATTKMLASSTRNTVGRETSVVALKFRRIV
jgi:hypothetical protein